jgi:hypothetical protein
MSSTKMMMIFNRKSIAVPNSNIAPRLKQTTNDGVVHNGQVNTNRKGVKSLFNLGSIMNKSTSCAPCKACGS